MNEEKLDVAMESSDCECCVCLQEPPEKVLQCSNGHIMCSGCYERIMTEKVHPKCPTCNVALSVVPNRNRFAEDTIGKRIVACGNNSCGERMKRSDLKGHLKNKCGKREVDCYFNVLGCELKITADAYDQHLQICEYRATEKARDSVVESRKSASNSSVEDFLTAPALDFRAKHIVVKTNDHHSFSVRFHAFNSYFDFSLCKKLQCMWYVLKRLSLSKAENKPEELYLSVLVLPRVISEIQFETQSVNCVFPKNRYDSGAKGKLKMSSVDVEKAFGHSLEWSLRVIIRRNPVAGSEISETFIARAV